MRSNSKIVKEKIRKHILDYFPAKDYGTRTRKEALKEQIEYMKYPGETTYQAGKRLAEGGSLLIYDNDIEKFINGLGINPKNKKYSNYQTFKLYTHLVGREVNSLLNTNKKKSKLNRY